jgi:glycosyltransferase involved in cell wall biosynthesis
VTDVRQVGDAALAVSVGILTYTSSIATVEATIRSVLDCAEIIVCDGHSTDGTRELAASLGCRVIDQDDRLLDDRGRLVDEAGAHEQMLAAASHGWVLLLDHDELATPELIAEMRGVVAAERTVGAYEIPRLYMLGPLVITCASVYPRYQPRLVHRDAVAGYGGLVHSQLILNDGETMGRLQEPMLVPQPPQRELWPKWRGYLRLEESNKANLSWAEWRQQVLRPQLRYARWVARRTLQVRRTCSGPRLPLRYEVSRVLYELAVIVYTGRRFVTRRTPDPSRAWR